ncbi:MAG: NADH-quinone oxidoreductase subunit D [Candidatus Krumholzibacteriia bacterium]
MSRKLIERLQQEFGPAILGADEPHGDATVEVAGADLAAVLRHLRDREQCELLLDVVGVDHPESATRFEVIYLLRSLARNQRLKVRVRVADGEAVESAVPLWHSADWHEREVYDLFGVPFRNHPDLRRLLCHHEFEGHALRKDYPIEQGQPCVTTENLFRDDEIAQAGRRADSAAAGGGKLGTDLLTVNIGPSHPATHGALRVECLLDGETIVRAKAEIGYLHRCFEKEAEDHTWAQVMPYTDRLNYCSALLNNVIYAGAVEKLLGVEVTPRCRAIRVIVGELARLTDHLVSLAANIVDLGGLTNYWYLYNVREGIYQVFEKLCGSRLTTNYARIGGLSHDLYPGFADEVLDHLGRLEEGVQDTLGLVGRNRIFLDRTVGVGVMSTAEALSWGWTGPCLRATGLAYDVRRHAPYLGYEDYEFDIPVGEHGDTYDRIMVRFAEMRQSARIIRQALARIPDGPVDIDDPRVVLPPKAQVYDSIEGMMNQFKLIYEGIRVPAGEAYGFGEGANGELGFYGVADGSGRPWRLKVRPPCFPIFSSYTRLIEGLMIPDAIAILGSLNIIAGELDR